MGIYPFGSVFLDPGQNHSGRTGWTGRIYTVERARKDGQRDQIEGELFSKVDENKVWVTLGHSNWIIGCQ